MCMQVQTCPTEKYKLGFSFVKVKGFGIKKLDDRLTEFQSVRSTTCSQNHTETKQILSEQYSRFFIIIHRFLGCITNVKKSATLMLTVHINFSLPSLSPIFCYLRQVLLPEWLLFISIHISRELDPLPCFY